MNRKTTQPIYLDYSATAPVRPEVISAIKPFADERFGNPASVHSYGRAGMEAIDSSRRKVADILNCSLDEVVFTSGGTEADNLAILGIAQKLKPAHIVTSAIEHKAVLACCRHLEKVGWRVTYIKPNRQGIVTTPSVVDAIKDETRLVSIMYVNNEIGTIQPIREIGKQIAKLNQTRKQKVWFHTDAVQAGTLLSLDTKYLHVDLLSLSAHKVGGLKGAGMLFIKTGVMVSPLILGGGQESGRRSGTLNVAGVVGLATALAVAQKTREKEAKRLAVLQAVLIKELSQNKDIAINGSITDRLPSNLNFSWKGKQSDELVIALDRQGIAVSAASACSSGSIEPSYVIASLGLPTWRSQSSLRISMGYKTNRQEINRLITALKDIE